MEGHDSSSQVPSTQPERPDDSDDWERRFVEAVQKDSAEDMDSDWAENRGFVPEVHRMVVGYRMAPAVLASAAVRVQKNRNSDLWSEQELAAALVRQV